MSSRGKRIVFLACAMLALAVLWQVLRDREPSYQGRALSEWVDQMQNRAYNAAEAQGAIRAIGTNAIPIAVKWISYEPRRFGKNRVVTLAREHLPGRISRNERRAYQAVIVFRALGADACSAIPQLTNLALRTSDRARADRCIEALAHLGPEALPGMLTLVTNSPTDTRRKAMFWLHSFGTNAAVAVPILIQCLDDKDSVLANQAASILSNLRVDRSAVFAALTNALRSHSAQVRALAVRCIMTIGTTRSEAVPVLLPLLSDPDVKVRENCTNVLLEIAPEVLTNAPPQ